MEEQSRLGVLGERVDELSRSADRWQAQVNERFTRIEARLDRVEQRLDRVEQRLDRLEQRLVHVEQRMDRFALKLEAIDQKFDRKFDDLRTDISKQFRLTMATLVTLLGTVLTVGAGLITALVTRGPF